MERLDRDVKDLRGVGEKRADLLSRLGIRTAGDLLRYYPRDYLDFSRPVPVREAAPDTVCCVRAVITAQARISRIRPGMTLYKFRAADDTAELDLTFFNNKYITDLLKEGQAYLFYGRVGGSLFRREMTTPEFERADAALCMRPVYPLTAGLSSRIVAQSVRQVLTQCGDMRDDPLPDALRKEYRLCHIAYALTNVHFPKDPDALETARRRLAFEELLTLTLGLMLLRGSGRQGGAPVCALTRAEGSFAPFYDKLPFEPTGAQRRAVEEAARDMARTAPMNRLVEGDVGSGKTVVAAALCFHAAQNALQSARMAPTEILAQQHFKTLSGLLAPCGLSVGLLTGSTPAAERRKTLRMLKTRELDVIVGTHALLSEDVAFERLGLVVTDEQHRFGVGQRAALATKGADPHVLVMSATPIPRTLALFIYGDLDISILDEMPRGRQKVQTFLIDQGKRARAFAYIKKHLDAGLQAFIVCPLVGDTDAQRGGDAQSLAAAAAYAEKIAREDFSGYRVGLLHGKLKPAQKEEVMRSFAAGALDLLVSTTVIEVGVDVPNAAVMVIENAERFGLSQLHQLRGRVGRGTEQSTCILVSDARGAKSRERLRTMCETTDGFKIAEKDLALRGPGDFFGQRQHGLPELKIADLVTDMELLRAAQKAARETAQDDPRLEKPENSGLRALVGAMFSKEDVAFN